MNVQKVRCVALRSVKYSDSRSMATLWTRELGRLAATVPSGGGRSAQHLRALMMPLGVFDAIVRVKAGSDVATLSDAQCVVASPGATGDPSKSVVGMFLADFLSAVLKDSGPDPLLSEFIIEAVALLTTIRSNDLANFHLLFLYKLSRFLGIEPDMGTYQRNSFFDMKEARFVKSMPLGSTYLYGEEAEMVHVLSRLSWRTLGRLQLSRQQRNRILDVMLEYYSLHHASLQSLTSLAIVRDVFSV